MQCLFNNCQQNYIGSITKQLTLLKSLNGVKGLIKIARNHGHGETHNVNDHFKYSNFIH